MNREIKFRGKDLNTGEWAYGDLHTLCDHPHIHTETTSFPFAGKRSFINTETIGQFTGLYDRWGKEIYEGDIIKVVDCVKVVKYIQECCSFCFGNIETLKDPIFSKWGDIYNYHQIDGRYWNDFLDDIVVIGNIHDNPELLK